MALTENQIEAVVKAVVTKAESMIENRVNARNGTPADKKTVKLRVAACITPPVGRQK